jgi:hypothetical protein
MSAGHSQALTPYGIRFEAPPYRSPPRRPSAHASNGATRCTATRGDRSQPWPMARAEAFCAGAATHPIHATLVRMQGLASDMLVDPREHHISDLQVVLVLKHHVAVAEHAHVRKDQHGHVPPGLTDRCRILLAACEFRRPLDAESRRRIGEVISEHEQLGDLGQLRDLGRGERRRATPKRGT